MTGIEVLGTTKNNQLKMTEKDYLIFRKMFIFSFNKVAQYQQFLRTG